MLGSSSYMNGTHFPSKKCDSAVDITDSPWPLMSRLTFLKDVEGPFLFFDWYQWDGAFAKGTNNIGLRIPLWPATAGEVGTENKKGCGSQLYAV